MTFMTRWLLRFPPRSIAAGRVLRPTLLGFDPGTRCWWPPGGSPAGVGEEGAAPCVGWAVGSIVVLSRPRVAELRPGALDRLPRPRKRANYGLVGRRSGRGKE